jgi:hypothetical protein
MDRRSLGPASGLFVRRLQGSGTPVIWCGCEAAAAYDRNSPSARLRAGEQGVPAPAEERTSRCDIRREAPRLVASGLSVIPLRPDGTKRPALDAWGPDQQVRSTAVTLAIGSTTAKAWQ